MIPPKTFTQELCLSYEKLNAKNLYLIKFSEIETCVLFGVAQKSRFSSGREDEIYINLPMLFASMQCKNKIKAWKTLNASKVYMQKMSRILNTGLNELFIDRKGVEYAHYKIIDRIMEWISPSKVCHIRRFNNELSLFKHHLYISSSNNTCSSSDLISFESQRGIFSFSCALGRSP